MTCTSKKTPTTSELVELVDYAFYEIAQFETPIAESVLDTLCVLRRALLNSQIMIVKGQAHASH